MSNQKILDGLRLNIDILTDFISAIPAEEIHKRRHADYWTIYEHLDHLAITQIILCRRIELFIKENPVIIKPFIPDDKPDEQKSVTKTENELLESFTEWRNKQMSLIETCNESTWKKIAKHPEYLSYTLEILIRHIYLHDNFHMNRIEELWLLKDEFLKKW